MSDFRRFWLTTLLPLAFTLPLLVNVTWERRVTGLPMDQTEAVVLQYGFPLPAVMSHCCTSTTPQIFAGPLLLNWAFALLWLTALGRWLWLRLRRRNLKLLTGLAWLLLVPTLLLNVLTFGLARWSLVSPYPVLETVRARLHLGFW